MAGSVKRSQNEPPEGHTPAGSHERPAGWDVETITKATRAQTRTAGGYGVSALLVVAARELFQHLGGPDLLVHACRITRDALLADFVVAFVSADEGETFQTEGQFGLSDEDWDAYQMVELTADIAGPIRHRLSDYDVSLVDAGGVAQDAADAERRSIALRMGVGPILLLGLRTRGVLSGLMIACRSQVAAPFEDWAVHVAQGLGPLLSASIENQRLVHALEAANAAQSEFLASMSHELRTPLNVIAGYLEMLLDGEAGDLTEHQHELCRRIRASALQQLALVGEALEMSRRDVHGRIPVRRDAISLPIFLGDLEREHALQPRRNDVQVTWQTTPGIPRIVSDPVKLRMIMRNLVENAIKFTDRGHVTTSIRLDGDVLEIVVRDTGVGIPEAERASIFTAFRQIGATRTSGIGLGLYIVRRLTSALDGEVNVESRLGEGSTFTVRIPVSRIDGVEAQSTA